MKKIVKLIALIVFLLIFYLFIPDKIRIFFIPVTAILVEGYILLRICVFITRKFKSKCNREKAFFIEELNNVKDNYQGGNNG